jgi:hypothetical protein
MNKPNELLCLVKAYGCEAYRIDGRIRVFRKWTTNKYDKEAKCKVREEHVEEMWLDEWNPGTPTLMGVKAECEAMSSSWALLHTDSPAIGAGKT